MSFFLKCVLPGGNSEWSCKVDATIWLTVGKGEKVVASHEMNTCFAQKQTNCGLKKFRQMSDLVAALNFDDDDGKTVKIVAYILVDKPVEKLPSTSS